MKIVDKKKTIGNTETLDIVTIGNHSLMIHLDGDQSKNLGGKGSANISL